MATMTTSSTFSSSSGQQQQPPAVVGTSGGGGGGVVVKSSSEGSFVVNYLGATMMDSHFNYTEPMMPWLVAEIMRFTEDLQALLMIKNHQVMANCARSGRKLFDAHVWDYMKDFAVVSDNESGTYLPDGRFYFVIIFKTNETYFHCRLFSSSSQSQVREIIATMKESAQECSRSSIRSSSTAAGTRLLSDLSASCSLNDSLSFEVFYMGKLRMSNVRKAPPTFIDEALEKFRAHELEKSRDSDKMKRIPSLLENERTSSQESSELGSTDSLLLTTTSQQQQPTTTTIPIITPRCDNDENVFAKPKQPISQLTSASASASAPVTKPTFSHPLEDALSPLAPKPAHVARPRYPSGGESGLVKSLSLPVEPMRTRALSTGHEPRLFDQKHGSSAVGSGAGNLTSNRTMLLIVCKTEIRIISPDTKTILFSKSFREMCHVAKGLKNKDCFGFICIETERIVKQCVSYVFRCESDSVASEVLKVLRQALIVTQETTKKESRQGGMCEHCPMQFFHTLCTELEGLSDERVLATIVKRVASFPEQDRENILTKFHGAEPQTISEQNELYMMLLRAHCESKQGKHIHDTPENRHEFLNQYLGGGAILMKAKKSLTNSFDQFLKKKGIKDAYNSNLSQQQQHYHQYHGFSFSPLLESTSTSYSNNSSSQSSTVAATSSTTTTAATTTPPAGGAPPARTPAGATDSPSASSFPMGMTVSDSPLVHKSTVAGSTSSSSSSAGRPRSSTIGALSSEKVRCDIRHRRGTITEQQQQQQQQKSSADFLTPRKQQQGEQPDTSPHSPIMNIFMKSASKSSSSSTPSSSSHHHHSSSAPGSMVRRQGGWRQAIFKRVVSPQTGGGGSGPGGLGGGGRGGSPLVLLDVMSPSSHSQSPISSRHTSAGGSYHRTVKRSKSEIHDLWKTAIKQQVLLIRMEKQNFMLRAKQEEVTVKRNKLNYMELGNCDEEANDTWDLIISQAQVHSHVKFDVQVLNSALIRGIPKYKRGAVWQLFMQQSKVGSSAERLASLGGSSSPPSISPATQNTSYEGLLHMLTSHQHAILIDLGRTFPSHQYFSGPLGSGQLALFNLLKAYSLLDPEVGYCQGLSFVAGILLMHLEEEEAFAALKYLMFDLGGREHYKADMLGLQIKMYQLTRLIHDQDSDIHLLLYHNDVLPTLYAAPWFLTIFSSQFPIGFAVRVLDVVMLHGFEVIVPFALALIMDRRQELLECNGLENVMECFKSVVTQVSSAQLDKYLKKVLEMDWEKQMLTYAVEYSVMHDDTFLAFLNQNESTTSSSANTSTLSANSSKSSLFKSSVPIIREDNEPVGGGGAVAEDITNSNAALLVQHIIALEKLLAQHGISVPKRPELTTQPQALTVSQPAAAASMLAKRSKSCSEENWKSQENSCDKKSEKSVNLAANATNNAPSTNLNNNTLTRQSNNNNNMNNQMSDHLLSGSTNNNSSSSGFSDIPGISSDTCRRVVHKNNSLN